MKTMNYPALWEAIRQKSMAYEETWPQIEAIEINVAKGLYRHLLPFHEKYPYMSTLTTMRLIDQEYWHANVEEEIPLTDWPDWIKMRRDLWSVMKPENWLRDDCTGPDDHLWNAALERVVWKLQFDTFDIMTKEFNDRYYGGLQ